MKRIAILILILTAMASAKDTWQVGYFRKMPSRNAAQIRALLADGYHVTLGTESSTCIGGDEHNAPNCGTDASWYGAMNSGRAIGFADGTAYACELGSCPDWFQSIDVVRNPDGTFLYRVNKKGEMQVRAILEDKFPSPVLDGQKHDLRK